VNRFLHTLAFEPESLRARKPFQEHIAEWSSWRKYITLLSEWRKGILRLEDEGERTFRNHHW
jgi:hypothetical protein